MIMLSRQKLIEMNDEKYAEMLKQVNIVDFTKCIAFFAGLPLSSVSDDSILEYLSIWARNKYRFFKVFGDKLSIDKAISYKEEDNESQYYTINMLKTEFPAFGPWLDCIFIKADLMDKNFNMREVYPFSRSGEYLEEYFKTYLGANYKNYDGQNITSFFKRELNAPDELVTKLAMMWEDVDINANFTISIDPVDMMLASENPYQWHSCYSLYNCHADGCLAAILDSTSIISYIWNKEGKFKLHMEYDFKNIRYKQKRAWASVNQDFNGIHVNKIYPRASFSDNFDEMWINNITEVFSKYLNVENKWEPTRVVELQRKYLYGYDESREDRVYQLSSLQELIDHIICYDEPIICPSGCGKYLPGSDDENYEYCGGGYIAENFDLNEDYDYGDDWEDEEEEEINLNCQTEDPDVADKMRDLLAEIE